VTGSAIALDTNAAIALLGGDATASAAIKDFQLLCLPVQVIGELQYGAINSARPKENLQAIAGLLSRATVLVADQATATMYAEIRAALKSAGRPIPENDVWIAASCVQHSLPLATRDAHFRNVRAIQLVAV
jgi:tRNA(fMet)-specific endonuclease VapC